MSAAKEGMVIAVLVPLFLFALVRLRSTQY
jgi:hypothetical protein